MACKQPVQLILGTMNFGPQVDFHGSRSMVETFLSAGHTEIDTAYVYNGGDSEKFLGRIRASGVTDASRIATKVNPRVTGRLDLESIQFQLSESLERLKTDAVDILYLHFPDPNTPVETTLKACAHLHAKGKFRTLGLSNFAAWQVVDIWHLCERNGWPKPEAYQGLYNALSRNVESELLPALRHLGMRFYAYNPLAGGILAGKYSDFSDAPTPGRFTVRPNYRDRYWKESFFAALHILSEVCARASIPIVAAAYRWLAFHSALDGEYGDGVILGASSLTQLQQNLEVFQQAPLPINVVEAFDHAWAAVRSDSPEYFRSSV